MEGPNPQRQTDATFGELPKVFIVYPHNPQLYTWNKDPQLRREETARREEAIRQHDQLVHYFAQFLQSSKITVAYEGMLTDSFTSNYMQWFQWQISESDFVILIITESFCPFLVSQKPPEDKERIFVGNFLHNMIHNPKKPLLPVFLNRPRNLDLLPDALKSSTTYTIMSTGYPPQFDVQIREMDSLFALLTRQNRIRPPPVVASVPIVNTFLRRRQGDVPGPVSTPNQFSERHLRTYETLRKVQRPISNEEMRRLAEKPGFAYYWRTLAEYFRFAPGEIDHIELDDKDINERCFQFLQKWVQRDYPHSTVSVLIEGVYSTKNTTMLEIAGSVIQL